MPILEDFKGFVTKNNLFTKDNILLLAVSGGVDSVVLCELCKRTGHQFIIAHCNFKLRGDESERDAAFVKDLARHYEVEFCLKEFDTKNYAAKQKLSIQEAARTLRYAWFEEIAGKQQAAEGALIVTAHHLDDNIETMLMHFFRGTGIQGLRGMLPKQGNIVRPLLFARKESLQQFAIENGLKWVEDSSNEQDKYSRNYIRHQVIPLVEKIYASAEANLAANLFRFADMEVLYEQSIAVHKKKLLEKKGAETHIPVLKLKRAEPLHSIVYEIIKDFGFTSHQVEEVVALLDSESGKYVQSASHRVIRNRNWLIIAPLQTEQAETILIEADGKTVFESGQLELERMKHKELANSIVHNHNNNIAYLNAGEVRYPFLLRKWKQGDYFYPLGMRKKKKLARFLIDQKLSLTDKERVWVLEMNKKIIWVVGMRIDDRFKVNDTNNEVLKIEWRHQ